MINDTESKMIDRIADGIDLAIDFLTLGQYGLERAETTSGREAGCEGGERANRCGRREALPPARVRGARTATRAHAGALDRAGARA